VRVVCPKVVDLFCGAGGLTRGFTDEGFDVVAGIDLDPSARHPYEANNDSVFLYRDVRSLTGDLLEELFSGATHRILAGCAPCQPFSSYTQGQQHDESKRWELLDSFSRLIEECRPEIVTMENVSRLMSHPNFCLFEDRLKLGGYNVWRRVVPCADYGVPQSRRRLVLLASRLGDIVMIPPSHPRGHWRTVRDAIGSLPPLVQGSANEGDPLHCSSGMSPKMLDRIKASRPGGSWHEWPESLRADCHKKESCKSYRSVYGRMSWDEPAPTLTTQCYGIGHGRFGHPEQDRAVSMREAAILQTFPNDYEFVRPGEQVQFSRLGRLIGNAVPVSLARAVAASIHQHLLKFVV